MNEQLGAVIVIYFQYDFFRVVDIDIKIYKLQIKMINQMSSISSFLLLSLKSEDFISAYLFINLQHFGVMIILQCKPHWKHSNWSVVNS